MQQLFNWKEPSDGHLSEIKKGLGWEGPHPDGGD